jgi:hypothetical protein
MQESFSLRWQSMSLPAIGATYINSGSRNAIPAV